MHYQLTAFTVSGIIRVFLCIMIYVFSLKNLGISCQGYVWDRFNNALPCVHVKVLVLFDMADDGYL
jgi:hypothetical protein